MSTLLIADDERTIREGIASAVDWKSLGIARVWLASDGREAYGIMSAERPDIAIVDIVMPEMTGIELISRCREEGCDSEFVIISGYDEFCFAQEALKNRVRDYILKPCDADEIADTMRRIVRDLDRKRALEADRRKLQDRLEYLAPRFREEALHDFLAGLPVNEERLHALRRSIRFGTDKLEILLFCGSGPENRRPLAALKSRADADPESPPRRIGVAMEDALVLVFDAGERDAARPWAEKLLEDAAETGNAGIKAAISSPGNFDSLPRLYRMAYQALKRSFLIKDFGISGPVMEAAARDFSNTVMKAIRIAEERFADNSLSLGKIATEILYLNGDYVGKLFKKECGVTFNEYLAAVRIEQAKRIMATSDDVRIYETAWQVGFGDDAAYFSRVFRKYVGVSPGEYRKLNRS